MKKLPIVIMMFLCASALFGQSSGWRLDKSHSAISFTVTHLVVSEVTGRFGEFDITFVSSKDDFSDATIEAVLKVNSITTDNVNRDNDLKSDNFFSAEKFPEIRFKSDSFRKTEGNAFKITGDLTIRDVTKKVTFDAEYRGSIATARGTVSAWKASTAINRFEYGLHWDRKIDSGSLVVGESVQINITVELRK